MNYLPKTYDEFKPLVAEIKAGNSGADFIGGGAESRVWRITLDDAEYVIKLANEYSARGRLRDIAGATEKKIATGRKAQGVAGLEQLQAASPEDGALVYGYIDGILLSKMAEEDIKYVTQDQMLALSRTVCAATRAGIEFDGMNEDGSNAIFNKKSGFTLIDYWSSSRGIGIEENRKRAVKSLGPIGVKLASIFNF